MGGVRGGEATIRIDPVSLRVTARLGGQVWVAGAYAGQQRGLGVVL